MTLYESAGPAVRQSRVISAFGPQASTSQRQGKVRKLRMCSKMLWIGRPTHVYVRRHCAA